MEFKQTIAELLSQHCNLDINEVFELIEMPPNPDMGDFAFPCFKLAKTLKKAPPQIATEIKEKITTPDYIEEIQTAGPYINFFLKKSFYAKTIITNILTSTERYGKQDIGKNKDVVFDYSSPNIAKPFHVGHLRSTVIGNALYNIYNELGYTCHGVNHLGDWGTQFGKLIVAYKKWGNEKDIEEKGIEELMRIYVKFHDETKLDTSLDDEARAWFVKMQNGDKEALELWKWFYDISIKEFDRVYDMLGVKFDAYTGESFYNDKMAVVVDELKEKNLLIESEGALIVDLEADNMPPCLIIRTDGGTLYATRDIAAALYRKKTYKFHKCIYLTAVDQNLHFKQWFKVIDKMRYDWADNLTHVPFGLVSLETGKLSTRQGNVVLMEDLLNNAIKETLKIINEKNPNLENKEQVSKDVGIGAVIFNDLYNSRIKDVVFSWERMLSFEGETGPYVQYTHARACSLLEKAQLSTVDVESTDFSLLSDPASAETLKLLSLYPNKIVEASDKNEPSVISRHMVNIAQAFNKFYHDNPILNQNENIKQARLSLVLCVKTVLSSGLSLLGINSPTKM